MDLVRQQSQLTVLAANLRLGDDQLARVTLVGIGERVLENADRAEDVSGDLDLIREVARVAENQLGLGLKLHLGLDATHGSLDTNSLASLVNKLIDISVEHVGAAIDGAEAGETLGQFTQTVEGIDVRRLSISSDTVSVQTNALDGLGRTARGVKVGVGLVESHSVAYEVLSRGFETKLVVDILHGAGAHVETYVFGVLSAQATQRKMSERPLTLVCGGILGVKLSNPLNKVLHATLLEDPHKRRPESLCSIGWNLGDGGLGSSTLLYVAACYLLELEISGNIGGDENVGKFAGGHEKLGHQVDVPVVQSAVLLPWARALGVVSILLEQLGRRQQILGSAW